MTEEPYSIAAKEITPEMVGAIICSVVRLPVREVESRHGGAVVVRTVARRENGPDLKAVDRQTIQVSRLFLEIQADKQTIAEMHAVLVQLREETNRMGCPSLDGYLKLTCLLDNDKSEEKPAKQIP
jgi:hypothetical protein